MAEGGAVGASQRWRADLAGWAIPEHIAARAVDPPWELPRPLFEHRTDRAIAAPHGPSYQRALQALGPDGGDVLDVGAGAGAGSLPLAGHINSLVAVDADGELLEALSVRAQRLGVPATTVRGRWPDVAARVPVVDVVVCHHLLYNVPDVEPFVTELTRHARRRVVVEITDRHPLAGFNPLWRRFHGVERPERPTAEQAVRLLSALGLPVRAERWVRPAREGEGDPAGMAERARRYLCLPPERSPEVAEAVRELRRDGGPLDAGPDGRALTTLWWDTGTG